ncbi:MAG: glycosyltransferase family 39 protein [Verrucomicrobia bacterium]|nr:glycosyltransferase family 39 protein [Verrucomicrobiota bacterium]MBU4247439.1 glycosyltransferase family 39 protein [Verrucomicrobiota bacterium]MBU4290609.1 glycosyltransferase family 39 protein [Verrucomicrobiota bacterium]MBU4496537.1 glycosyltransferase family 39 protein [Verrucomicrobiota bacterium]MCG2679486.1 glycosyltransferase family 39 protein [Kiritimatiellia bacterium]
MQERLLAIMTRLAAWCYFPLLCLSLTWGVMVFLVNPVGEFPLNDTWAFSGPVKTLLETGSLKLSHWPFMSLIAHLAWGYLVSSIFGFSYTVLRCSIAFLGLVGIWGLYALLMEVTRDRRMSFLGAAVLAGNPLYFHLACTFMTDVPFMTFCILSFLLLIKGIRRESLLLILGGILLACWATLIRQVGLIIPVSFAIAYGFKHRLRWPSWVMGILAVAAVFSVLAGYEYWLDITGKTPLHYRSSEGEVLAKLKGGPRAWLTVADTAMACFVYLGLFLLPVLLWLLPGREWRTSRPGMRLLQAALLIGWTLGVTAILLHQHRLMPLRMNGSILYDWGLGPPTLRDIFQLGRPHLPRAPEAVMILLTALGAMGGGLLLKYIWHAVWQAWSSWREKRHELVPAWASIMALSAFVMYFTPMAILVPFDRYLLFCVPLLLVLLFSILEPLNFRLISIKSLPGLACLLAWAIFAVGGTHDYLAWNRARWQAARDLMEKINISPASIDGGFEFNGLFFYDPFYANDGDKSWWWVQDDQYVIAFGPLRNYTECARYRYRRWFPPGYGWIQVLRRNDGNELNIILAATRKHGGEDRKFRQADIVRYWHGDGNSAPVALSYGDCVDLEPGRYTATLYYLARKPKHDHRHGWGQIRLVKFDNGPAIVEAEIDPVETSFHTYRTQSVEFSLEKGLPVEAQIIGGDARLWLYRIVFKKAE